jgi:hypothetical protein
MEEHEQTVRGIDGLAIDADVGDGVFIVGRENRFSIDGDAALADPGASLTSAAVAVAGENLIDASRLFAHKVEFMRDRRIF